MPLIFGNEFHKFYLSYTVKLAKSPCERGRLGDGIEGNMQQLLPGALLDFTRPAQGYLLVQFFPIDANVSSNKQYMYNLFMGSKRLVNF